MIVPVFKTGEWQVYLSLVGSTPTRFRHLEPASLPGICTLVPLNVLDSGPRCNHRAALRRRFDVRRPNPYLRLEVSQDGSPERIGASTMRNDDRNRWINCSRRESLVCGMQDEFLYPPIQELRHE